MYGMYGFGMWLVKDRDTDKLIGRAGLELRLIDGVEEMELGYIIVKNTDTGDMDMRCARQLKVRKGYSWCRKTEYNRVTR